MGHGLGFSLVCFAGLMATACPQGQEVFASCQIESRDTVVLVCFDDHVATYSYGPIGGQANLLLSEAIERVDFEPWSGTRNHD